jgi:hypothetical protein
MDQSSITTICDSVFVVIEIYGRMAVLYGYNYISQWKVYEYVKSIKERRKRVDDNERSRRRLALTRVEVKEKIDQRIRNNQRISII